jgi:hypothetical protein
MQLSERTLEILRGPSRHYLWREVADVAVKVAAWQEKCDQADAVEEVEVADRLDEEAHAMIPDIRAALAALDKAAMEVGR